MTTFAVLLATLAPAQPPAAPEIDAKQLAAWVADLSNPDFARQTAARDTLVKAGPKAKAVVPDLVKLLVTKDDRLTWGVTNAVAVLKAIGPDAKDAVPALMSICKVQGYSGFPAEVGGAIARIDGPKPEVTRVLLLTVTKGSPILLSRSEYFRTNQAAVVGHLLTLCADKEPEARRKAVVVLAGLPEGAYSFSAQDKPPVLEVGEVGKDAPAVFEKLLADEDALVRMTAAHGLSRVAPKHAARTIPVVIATMSDPRLKEKVAGVPAADIFRPIPEDAAKALIPLFDGADHGRRWAINTLSQLPVRGQLEATLQDATTARTREAAAITIGFRGSDGARSVPVLKAALADREFPVRFAASVALVNVSPRGTESAAIGVPVLIEGLKQMEDATRFLAAHYLRTVGERARPAVPDLKRALADPKPSVALESALALVEIARSEAADAVPVLVAGLRSEEGTSAIRAARALGLLGPVAKAAVPELVKRFDPKTPAPLRLAAAEAAAVIDPEQSAKATDVLVALVKQSKGGALRTDSLNALARIGPPAKAALPALLEEWAEVQKRRSYVSLELALAMLAIDPETAKPVRAWIREQVTAEGTEDGYDLARQFRKLGARAKPLLDELIAMLGCREAYVRECAAVTLGEIGPDAREALHRLKGIAEKDGSTSLRKLAANAVRSIEGR